MNTSLFNAAVFENSIERTLKSFMCYLISLGSAYDIIAFWMPRAQPLSGFESAVI